MPKLVAEITAETSGLEAGLRRADGMVEKFGEKVKHHLVKSFGYGLVATAIGHAIREHIERAEQLSENAAKLKINTDEYQALEAAARKASMGVEEFVEAGKKNGMSLDQQIANLGDYRREIKMTAQEVAEFKDMKAGGAAFMSGVTGPIAWLGRKLYNTIGGTAVGTAGLLSVLTEPFGYSVGGIKSEDYFLEFYKHFKEYYGMDASEFREGTDSAALGLPAGTRLKRRQHAIAKKQAELNALVRQERDLTRPEPHTAWLAPGVTDWQSMGAMTRMPSVAVTDAERQNQEQLDKLEEVRKEIADVKEAIRKMSRGED